MAEEETLDIIELEDNLADVEKPPELSPGMYTAEIQDVQVQVSQGKGNKYYAIKCVISVDDIPSDLREHFPDGVTLSWNRQLVPKKGDRRSLYSLRKLIEAMGLDAATTTIDPNEWMGSKVRVKIRQKPFEGEMRAEIAAIEAAEAEGRVSKARANGKAAARDEEEEEEEVDPPTRRAPAGRGASAKPSGRGAARR